MPARRSNPTKVFRYQIMLPAATAPTEHEIEWPERPGHERLDALIEPIVGGYAEHVSVLWRIKPTEEFRPMDMFVAEDGGRRRLPLNELATKVYQNNMVMMHGAKPKDLHVCVGPAVLFHDRVWH